LLPPTANERPEDWHDVSAAVEDEVVLPAAVDEVVGDVVDVVVEAFEVGGEDEQAARARAAATDPASSHPVVRRGRRGDAGRALKRRSPRA
jgi:hypothetical protein